MWFRGGSHVFPFDASPPNLARLVQLENLERLEILARLVQPSKSPRKPPRGSPLSRKKPRKAKKNQNFFAKRLRIQKIVVPLQPLSVGAARPADPGAEKNGGLRKKIPRGFCRSENFPYLCSPLREKKPAPRPLLGRKSDL